MTRKFLTITWLVVSTLFSTLCVSQHLSIAQVLEINNAPVTRREAILKANGFVYQSTYTIANTSCHRYSRTRPDLFGDDYEETVSYCLNGSFTYVTFSPDHATNLKYQLIQKFDFQDQGPFTSPAGLLKNLYQRRNQKVETANTRNTTGQDMWVFQFYEDNQQVSELQSPHKLADIPVNPALPEPLRGRFYALFIGVNEYTDRRIPDLTFPIDDAEKLKRVLIDTYTFSDRTLMMLKNPTRKAILRAFDDLSYRLRKDDNLLIFFAGHGREDKKSQQGYWLPADAQSDYNDDWLSNSIIRDQLRRFSCQHVLVISDACFSGELISARGSNQPSKAIQQLYSLRSRRAITSSGNTIVPDKSVFINYLVQRLAENTKPYLTANELFVNMREAVINNSSLPQVPMYGYIQQAGDEGGDFIFIRKPN